MSTEVPTTVFLDANILAKQLPRQARCPHPPVLGVRNSVPRFVGYRRLVSGWSESPTQALARFSALERKNHVLDLTKTSIALVAAALLLLTGCSGAADQGSAGGSTSETSAAPVEPLDLTGEWKQTNSKSEDAYQSATIADGIITVNWVTEADSGTALYWVGTFEAPTGPEDAYAWTSQGDTEQMSTAILASGDDAKDFSYENGVLSYEVTALGVTTTVELER